MAGVYAEATTVKVANPLPVRLLAPSTPSLQLPLTGVLLWTAAPLPRGTGTAATFCTRTRSLASDNIQQATKQKAAAYKAEQCSAAAAVANGAADAAVKAADVRAAAAQALDMLATKRTTRLPKKHGNITL